jgi:hypothetical protein
MPTVHCVDCEQRSFCGFDFREYSEDDRKFIANAGEKENLSFLRVGIRFRACMAGLSIFHRIKGSDLLPERFT